MSIGRVTLDCIFLFYRGPHGVGVSARSDLLDTDGCLLVRQLRSVKMGLTFSSATRTCGVVGTMTSWSHGSRRGGRCDVVGLLPLKLAIITVSIPVPTK
eukprot:scaffold3526_cov115-Cylindrotheca_fusiformis.AAC.1